MEVQSYPEYTEGHIGDGAMLGLRSLHPQSNDPMVVCRRVRLLVLRSEGW